MSEKAPFPEVGLVVVDGNNLLHRTAGGPGPTAARLLLARLRAALPAGVPAIVVLGARARPGRPPRRRARQARRRPAPKQTRSPIAHRGDPAAAPRGSAATRAGSRAA